MDWRPAGNPSSLIDHDIEGIFDFDQLRTRRRRVEGALDCALTQTRGAGDLRSDAHGATTLRAGLGFSVNLSPNLPAFGQELGIAPDMFVPLVFGQIAAVKALHEVVDCANEGRAARLRGL